MRRMDSMWMLGLGLAFCLLGCEGAQEVAAVAHDLQPFAAGVEAGSQLVRLENGRIVRADPDYGLQFIDVRDPEHPRLESTFGIIADKIELYATHNFVLMYLKNVRAYPNNFFDPEWVWASALFMIDATDPANPSTVQSEIQPYDTVQTRLLRLPGRFELFAGHTEPGGRANIVRYELISGWLTTTFSLSTDGPLRSFALTPDTFMVATATNEAPDSTRIIAIRMPAEDENIEFTNFLEVPGVAHDMLMEGDRARVLYKDKDTGEARIDTFDLGAPQLSDPIAYCAPEVVEPDGNVPQLQTGVFSSFDRVLYASVTPDQHTRLGASTLDAAGGCDSRLSLEQASAAYALHVLHPNRLLALTPEHLSLVDTTEGDEAGVITGVDLPLPAAAIPAGSWPISSLSAPAKAADATPEPWVLALPAYKFSADSQAFRAGVQLLTLSDRTLTPRALLEESGLPQQTLFAPGGRLITSASELVSSFDLSDLKSTSAVGQLAVSPSYRGVFRVEEHLVRIAESAVHFGPLNPEAMLDELQVLPLSASFATDQPVARLQVRSFGKWLQVGALLVNVLETPEGAGLHTSIQVIDLRDPSHPRSASELETSEIISGASPDTSPALVPHVLDHTLVFSHRQDTPELDVIDLSDPDRPMLVRPAFRLPNGAEAPSGGFFARGNMLYAGVISADARTSWTYPIDFSDPAHPILGTRTKLPGDLKLWVDADRYTTLPDAAVHALRQDTLTRLQGNVVQATRSWPGLEITHIARAGTGRLAVVSTDIEAQPYARAHLEILDAQTLETLGSFQINHWSAGLAGVTEGRALLSLPTALQFIDIRDPQRITVQASMPPAPYPLVVDSPDIYAADQRGARHYTYDSLDIDCD